MKLARKPELAAPEGVSRAARRRLQTVLENHGMLYDDSGECRCGVKLHGRYELAEQHFNEVAFAAGMREAGAG